MKGLILKDLYTIKSFGRQYGLTLGCMVLWAIFMKTVSFVYVFATMLGTMAILSVVTIDEAVSFNLFALTMPINTRILVKAKYCFFAITTGIGILAALLVSLFITLLPMQGFAGFNWREIVPVVVLFVLGTAAALPVIFYKGAEKGRYVYIAVMMGMGGMVYMGAKLCMHYQISLTVLETMPGILYGAIFAAVCIAAIMISYLVSVRLLRNRQW